jgi:hypothetical protein
MHLLYPALVGSVVTQAYRKDTIESHFPNSSPDRAYSTIVLVIDRFSVKPDLSLPIGAYRAAH